VHFGHISSYVNEGGNNMHLSGILWWLEILIPQFNIMVKDIQKKFKLTKDEKYQSIVLPMVTIVVKWTKNHVERPKNLSILSHIFM
jgi:hypothetical protein